MNNLKKELEAFYLDYVCNYLTVEKIAEHYGISENLAQVMIDETRIMREERIELEKFINSKQ